MNPWALLVATASGATDLPLPEASRHRPVTRLDVVGYRAAMPAGDTQVGARFAMVGEDGGPFIGELCLRGQGGWKVFGWAVEVVGTTQQSEWFHGSGLGNLVVDARGLFGRGYTAAIGLRANVALPTGREPVAWWGTVPAATIPRQGLALAVDFAIPRVLVHAHGGPALDWTGTTNVAGVVDFDLLVAVIQPISGRWSIVGEAEALAGASPYHLRALARAELGRGWVVDAGLAVPLPAMTWDPTLQVIGGVRWSPASGRD